MKKDKISTEANKETITIKTQLTVEKLKSKLRKSTITDLSNFHNSPTASYYGKVNSNTFQLKNKKYSPYSTTPMLKGIFNENGNHTTINITLDTDSHYNIIKSTLNKTLLPLGTLTLLLSIFALNQSPFQIHGIIFSSTLILLNFLILKITKSNLIKSKKEELELFTSILKE